MQFPYFSTLLASSAFLRLHVFALSLPKRSPSLPLPSKVLYQFPDQTWIENFAVRSDNQLLLTQINPANLYLLNPAKPDPPTLIHTFSSASSLMGIVELYPNIFYVIAGNYSIANGNTPGTCSLWEIDFNPPESSPAISKVAEFPEAGLLNGMVAIPTENALLIADSAYGTIIRFDVVTGTSSLFLSGPDLDPPSPPAFQLGIDGLGIHGKYVYFTDFGEETLFRFPFASNATLPEEIGSGFFGDDLDVDTKGRSWVAANFNNQIIVVGQSGEVTTVLGSQDQLTVAGPTSVRFGKRDQVKTLFVVTCGALGAPVNGTETVGGQVLAIDTNSFCRKKSKCPGEKPSCSHCARLGQLCVYENDGVRLPDSLAEASPEVEHYQRRMEHRIESLEVGLREVIGSIRRQNSDSSHPRPRLETPTSIDLQTEQPRSTSTNTLPSWNLILDSANLYLKYCDCQPLPLFVRETFMDSLTSRIQEPEILFALLALTIRFSSAAYYRDNPQGWITGYTETARSLVMKRVSKGPIELSTLQSLCILSLVDYTNGNTQRASIHSSLAMSLAHSANISAEIDDQISDLLLEERRRCFWGIWLLRQLHGEDCRLLEISDEDQYPNYPKSASQPSSNGKRILSFSGSTLRTEKPDLGIVGYSIQLSDVWFKTTKYGRRRSKPSRIPPWSPQSEYATIMAQEMDYETRMAPIHRYKPSDFANRTSEELNASREYWAPWLFVQFLYHTNLCLLNHPLLFSLRLRNITSMIPEIFLQHTDDLIVSHASWIVHLIDVLEAKSFFPSDPFLGHCAAIAATIFLQESYRPRDVGTNDKEEKFSKCLRFVRSIAIHWPHVSRIAENLQKLKDTVSQTYQTNVGTPNRRLLIDLGRFWEILEYPSASERSRDDTHFGASLKGRKINISEILDTTPLPEPVRVGTMHNSGLDGLASASEFAASMNQMDDPTLLYSTDELAVLAESFFQQRDGYVAGGIEDWGFGQRL